MTRELFFKAIRNLREFVLNDTALIHAGYYHSDSHPIYKLYDTTLELIYSWFSPSAREERIIEEKVLTEGLEVDISDTELEDLWTFLSVNY